MYRAKTKITPSSNFGLLSPDQWHYLAHGPAIISYHSFQIDAHCFWNIGKHFYCSVKMFQWRAFFSVIKLKIECFYGIPSNVNELNGEAECKEKHAKVIAIIPCFKKKNTRRIHRILSTMCKNLFRLSALSYYFCKWLSMGWTFQKARRETKERKIKW